MLTNTLALALTTSVVVAGSAAAVIVPVSNPSFEQPGTTTFAADIVGWSESDGETGAFVGILDETLDSQVPDAVEGTQWAFIRGASTLDSMWQSIGTVDTSLTYEISFTAGRRGNQGVPNGDVQLWGGGTAPDVGSGSTLLGSIDVLNAASVTSLAAQTASISPTTNNGDTLWLLFNNDGQGQLLIDAVSIQAIPEPATLALLGVGLAFAARRRSA